MKVHVLKISSHAVSEDWQKRSVFKSKTYIIHWAVIHTQLYTSVQFDFQVRKAKDPKTWTGSLDVFAVRQIQFDKNMPRAIELLCKRRPTTEKLATDWVCSVNNDDIIYFYLQHTKAIHLRIVFWGQKNRI